MATQFKIHTLRGYIQSLYLVESKEGLLLFDSGTRADVLMVVDYIKNVLQRPLTDLKLVAVSHAHPDHSGGAAYFQQLGIPIAGNLLSNEWYAGPSGWLTYIVDIGLTYLVWSKKKKEGSKVENLFFPRKLKYDYFLENQSELPYFKDWKSFDCHGHTQSDLSFYNESEGILYVGDNLISNRKGFISPYPIAYPEAYKKSLEFYLTLTPKKLLLAHYDECEFNAIAIEKVLNKVSLKPRRHRTALLGILLNFVRKVKKR